MVHSLGKTPPHRIDKTCSAGRKFSLKRFKERDAFFFSLLLSLLSACIAFLSFSPPFILVKSDSRLRTPQEAAALFSVDRKKSRFHSCERNRKEKKEEKQKRKGERKKRADAGRSARP